MEITLWGVRGSIPNAGPETQFYGANTTCIEARPASGDLIIFDAGTGISSLGASLPARGECHICITHGHADHVQGLCFFQPFFNPDWTIHLHLPEWLGDIPQRLFDGSTFPVPFAALKANIITHLVAPGSRTVFAEGPRPVFMEAFEANHPGRGLAYKLHADDAVFLFSGDHEITAEPRVRALTAAMLEGVDAAVVDAFYFREDYMPGWGHSAWEDWAEAASEARLGLLVLSHHAQTRKDSELDLLQERLLEHEGTAVAFVGREGMSFSLPAALELAYRPSDWLLSFIDTLSQHKEESILLDRILSKTREVTNADAGTIFLVDGNDLVFSYSHNESLIPLGSAHTSAYINMRLPISAGSIAGYVALTGETLNLPDVYALSPELPYSHNESFDKKTGYVTRSMLVMPILSRGKKLLGVLQLINSLHPRKGTPQAFTVPMIQTVRVLAREAAVFLEISSQMRASIERLLRIAIIHDPAETGPHAERVGSIAAELYQRWAIRHHLGPETIRFNKGQIRLAAMLHDIGKVGISDLILKKNGKLDDAEFAIMRRHTSLGAELFLNDAEDIIQMTRAIALHHHQKWNGKGYPDVGGALLAGEDIPLVARLTAIADVFDALVSPRCYKPGWTRERAEALLREEAGKHFDPELVECFFEISDTISMIYERYPDAAPKENTSEEKKEENGSR